VTSGLPNCFVAGVVYGADSREVEILRDYRDKVLSRNVLGRKVIDLYYSGAGERMAHLIESRFPFAIPFIRKGLDVIVEGYSRSAGKM